MCDGQKHRGGSGEVVENVRSKEKEEGEGEEAFEEPRWPIKIGR